MLSEWLDHNNKKIIFCNYAHMDSDALRNEIGLVEASISQEPQNSVLVLVDVRSTLISPATLDLLKNTALGMRKYIKRTAVLGVTGVRRPMLDMVIKFSGLSIRSFDDELEAKDWLTS